MPVTCYPTALLTFRNSNIQPTLRTRAYGEMKVTIAQYLDVAHSIGEQTLIAHP